MRTTVAVVNEQGQEFTFDEVEIDGPRADEVLVRIVATGLCHTDLALRDTLPPEMFPRVFGHEGAGVVEQVGSDVAGIDPGDHVVLSLRSCRACPRCAAGLVGYCENSAALNHLGFRMDGSTTYSRASGPVHGSFFGQSSFAQHAIASPDNVVVVDRALDLARLGPYGGSFQTGAGAVLNVLRPDPGDSLVVYGVGAVGLAAVAAATGQGVGTVVAVDRVPARLEVAATYGALPVDAGALGEVSLADRVRELTGGGASAAIDTTGVPEVVREAARSLAVRGRLVLLARAGEELLLDAADLLEHGKEIRGSLAGDADPLELVPRLLGLAADGRFDVDALVTPYPFSQINSAIDDLVAGRVVKPVLVW